MLSYPAPVPSYARTRYVDLFFSSPLTLFLTPLGGTLNERVEVFRSYRELKKSVCCTEGLRMGSLLWSLFLLVLFTSPAHGVNNFVSGMGLYAMNLTGQPGGYFPIVEPGMLGMVGPAGAKAYSIFPPLSFRFLPLSCFFFRVYRHRWEPDALFHR